MEFDTAFSESEIFTKKNGDRYSSMTILSPQSLGGQPRMAQLETLEAKMANIEVSLSSATPRRRKGTSIGGGSISTRSSPRPESASREIRSALQDREAVIQNLRVQLGLNKLPRPSATPLDDSERPVAEQKLSRLKIDADNKKIAIRNLRQALEKLDITDNIDVRIRQAELEYALGREELQLLSLVEEARALQGRLEKSKPESNSIFCTLQCGVNLSLHAVIATVGRWSAAPKSDSPGLWIEWALDGEGLYRGDRIIELNGKLVNIRTRDELQRILSADRNGKCQLVVLRKKTQAFPHQQLLQSQEDNVRLQHRISYLEDQVKELQLLKENLSNGSSEIGSNDKNESHITSINISSPPSTPPEKPQIFQRGNFVTTIIGGKAVDSPPTPSTNHHNGSSHHHSSNGHVNLHHSPNGIGNHHHSTNGNANHHHSPNSNSNHHHSNNGNINYHHHSPKHNVTKTIIKENGVKNNKDYKNYRNGDDNHLGNNLFSSSAISINSDLISKLSRRELQRHLYNNREINNSEVLNHHHKQNNNNVNNHARSVEHLNYNSERRREILPPRRPGTDLRSVKSLDFESDGNNTDYASEPNGPRMRPTPPKKPLRLSLQRAQSLQTVEAGLLELEKKRAMKRTHKGDKMNDSIMQAENGIPHQTASLGRNKHNI